MYDTYVIVYVFERAKSFLTKKKTTLRKGNSRFLMPQISSDNAAHNTL